MYLQPVSLRVTLSKLIQPLSHLLDEELDHVRDRLLGPRDQGDPVLGAREHLVVLAHHDVRPGGASGGGDHDKDDDLKTPARYLSSAIVSPPLPMTWPATLLQVDS